MSQSLQHRGILRERRATLREKHRPSRRIHKASLMPALNVGIAPLPPPIARASTIHIVAQVAFRIKRE